MKATVMNSVARNINARRNSFEGIVSDFRATWGKVFPKDAKSELQNIVDALKVDKNNAALKADRYALECVLAKMKSIALKEDEVALVKEMNEEGMKFKSITMDYLKKNLPKEYLSEDGLPMEQKTDKATGVKKWMVIEKWTVMKVGRYFRIANINYNAKKAIAEMAK